MKLEEVKKEEIIVPPWFGFQDLHSSHRANLIRKNPSHYRDQFGWNESPKVLLFGSFLGYFIFAELGRIFVDFERWYSFTY
jgi:hypothetical protein